MNSTGYLTRYPRQPNYLFTLLKILTPVSCHRNIVPFNNSIPGGGFFNFLQVHYIAAMNTCKLVCWQISRTPVQRLPYAVFFIGRNKADRYVSGRLTKTMYRILQSDTVSNRGEHRVTRGELNLLEGFNFNSDTSLQNVLWAPYSVMIDHGVTQAIISFPSFMARAMIENFIRRLYLYVNRYSCIPVP